jgi:folylpolyglutamate synthase/dihydropteroate synthase
MRSAGLHVGVFTSPHLHSARERVKVGNDLISMPDIVRLGQASLDSLANSSWSVFFDVFLLTGLFHFFLHTTIGMHFLYSLSTYEFYFLYFIPP